MCWNLLQEHLRFESSLEYAKTRKSTTSISRTDDIFILGGGGINTFVSPVEARRGFLWVADLDCSAPMGDLLNRESNILDGGFCFVTVYTFANFTPRASMCWGLIIGSEATADPWLCELQTTIQASWPRRNNRAQYVDPERGIKLKKYLKSGAQRPTTRLETKTCLRQFLAIMSSYKTVKPPNEIRMPYLMFLVFFALKYGFPKDSNV